MSTSIIAPSPCRAGNSEDSREDHIAVYGPDNHLRLTGKHETQSIHQFSYGVADRRASIRVPNHSHKSLDILRKSRFTACRTLEIHCSPHMLFHDLRKYVILTRDHPRLSDLVVLD